MPRSITSPNYEQPPGMYSVLPIHLGGTDALDPIEAARNLQIISNSQVGTPGGAVPLGIDGKIPVGFFSAVLLNQQNPSISGPLSLALGETGTYTIVNYNVNDIYSINTVGGTATQTGNTISYTAPTTPGTYGFILNGVNVIIDVTEGNFTVTGPTTVNENTVASYTINNYNASIQYTVRAISGSVSINGATISYTAPATDGVDTLYSGFYVNQTPISLTILPPNPATVTGPSSAAIGQSSVFTITNYVATSTYNIVALAGTVSRVGDQITYIAPTTVGTYGFTINQITVAVQIVLPTIMQPTIIAPVNNSTNLGPNLSFTGSAFTMTAGTDSQVSASWQLATDASFLNIVLSSMNDTVNLTSWAAPNLINGTTYYVRVQYTGLNNEVSAWSPVVSFTTKQNYIPTAVSAQYTGSTGTSFGYSVAVNDTGDTVVIGAPDGNAVFVYTVTNGTWALTQTINAPTGATGFGISVTINGVGNTILIGSDGSLNAFLFALNNGIWTQSFEFLSPLGTGAFGYSVGLNDAATVAAIGDHLSDSVFLYTYSNTTWTLLTTLTGVTGTYFGYSISLNSVGTLLAIGAYLYNQVVIYNNGGTGWAVVQTINTPDNGGYFGVSVFLSKQSYTLVIGADTFQKVYVYTSSNGSVWTLYQSLTSPDPATTAYFGRSVAMSGQGNVILIGAYVSGKVYLYQLQGSQYTLAQTFTYAQAPTLGFSVAINLTGTLGVSGDYTSNIGVAVS